MADDFLNDLRRGSRYPVFRGFVKLFIAIGFMVAFVTGLASIMMLGTLPSGQSTLAFIMCLALAIAVYILTRLGAELMLMGADTADAVLQLAEQQRSAPVGADPENEN